MNQLDTYPTEDGNPFRDGSDYILNGGLDAKIGITNDLTLDLTVNPDFGQVEADPGAIALDGFPEIDLKYYRDPKKGMNILRYLSLFFKDINFLYIRKSPIPLDEPGWFIHLGLHNKTGSVGNRVSLSGKL